MSTIVFAADSTTLTANGFVVTDFAEGDIITMTPVNPSTSHVNSSGGGVNINRHVGADVYDMVVRVQALSPSDAFLNGEERQDVPTVFNGSLKENFTRDGTDGVESWTLENGSFLTKPTRTYNNTDGNSVIEYTIRWRTAKRNL